MSKTLANNIRYLMTLNSVKSPSELARLTKIAQPTLYRWMVEDAREPRHSSLKPLADFFNVTVFDLLERNLETGDKVQMKAFVTARREVPLGRVTKDGLELENLKLTDTRPALLVHATREMFAITVRGDAMAPAIPDGAVAILDPKLKLASGTVVLARDPDTRALVFRRLIQEGGHWFLLAENAAFGANRLIGEPDVLGTVVEVQIVRTF